jgi:purine nucleosidase
MRRVWLDADPGFDDWLTMLMLAVHPRLRWLGISVVAGNAPLDITLANALRIRHHYGLNVPLHGGSAAPLAGALQTAQHLLGAQGMRTTGEPLPDVPHAQPDGHDAVAAMINALLASAEPVTLLAIGPLTNVALALQKEPRLREHIAELVLMGGSTDRGNHTPAAEFNIAADPEAADIVFSGGLPLRLFGLNVCRQVLLARQHVETVQSWPGARAAWLAGYLDAYQRLRKHDGSVPMPLYDPVVAAWLWQPELFAFQPARVDIELQGRFTRGMTVCDFRVGPQRRANAEVAMTADGPAVIERVLRVLRQVAVSSAGDERRG